ncbi:hypothetical protein BBBOND_0313910 [Babesia bigemina]|uniref:C3H1-type domain-containing protein n=1 Tax=Babesia bigemina TaxID=5866 RepID=A0A061DDJ8_BABBI|nr:hypothetical protein BBBOND_0313910 [Babesia bigemina]CDR97489.1 hypothetical protein BBBOND_0313910 [Babesia bigemina]|eukprot:XP_012769675.1 hypothetical protein BBBOND_0313910 [Babesia bigemina]
MTLTPSSLALVTLLVNLEDFVKKAVKNAIIAVINSNEELKHLYSSYVTNLSESVKSAGQADGTGEIEKLSKQVSQEIDDINRLLSKPNNLHYNSLSSPSPSAELAKLQSKLEALKKVEKLCGFLTNLNTKQNEPKNLLVNLCDGLQTFLGFNPSSKGYTGDGIVYSDLDRLCDGVMGFLSGVLSNIKEHLGQHKETITPVIKILNTNKHGGKKGFNAAIGSVVAGVGRYNDGVRKSNLKVRKQIENFEREINTLKMKINDINENIDIRFHSEAEKAEKSVRNASSNCQQYAATFNETFNLKTKTEMKNDINDLNHPLSLKVIKAVGFVKDESERFKKLSDKESRDFDTMKSRIESVCTDHGKKVNAHICKEVTELVTKLRMLVRAILDELKKIEKNLFEYVQDLTKWIEQANTAVEAALEKVHIIITAVSEDSVFSNVKPIKKAAQELYDRAFELFDAGNKANKAADEHVKAALAQVKEMDGKLKEDLFKVKTAIRSAVNGINAKITALGNKFTSITKGDSIEGIVEHIRNTINGIHGGTRGDTGLGAIKQIIKTYVSKSYTGDQFAAKVAAWVGEIVISDAINGKLKVYVNENTGRNNNYFKNTTTTKSVTEKLQKMLIEEIKKLFAEPRFTDDSVESRLKVIQQNVKAFGSSLLSSVDSKLPTIVQAMEDDEELKHEAKSDTAVHIKRNLQDAVTSTFKQLALRSTTAAMELNSLLLEPRFKGKAQTSASAYLDNALRVADELYENLKVALRDKSDRDQNHAKAVDNAITEVTNVLKNQMPEESAPKQGSHVKLEGAPSFTQYNSFVDQTEDKLAALSNPDFNTIKEAGTLPAAIGEIQRGVEAALSEIGIINGKVQDQFNTLTSDFQQLCEAVMKAARDDKDNAKTILEKLKNTYFKHYDIKKKDAEDSIKKIKHDLETLRAGPVTRALTFGEQFLKPEADKLRDETTEKLKQQIDEEVAKAKKELTTRARIDYVSTMKMLLLHYEDRVTKELTGIRQEISDDLITGFKGFMGTFAGENGRTVSDVNIEKLKSVATTMSSTKYDPKQFTDLAKQFQSFWHPLNTYLKKEIKRAHAANNEKTNPEPTDVEKLYTSKIDSVTNELNILLNHLREHNRYDNKMPEMLDILSTEVDGLHPESFSEPSTPLLDGISKGLGKFAAELSKTYLNAYDGASDGMVLVDARNDKVTDDGNKCAKVCLSLLSILYSEFKTLLKYCVARCKSDQININTELGKYFATQGYKVTEDGKKHWELQDSKGMTGLFICKRMFGKDEHHLYYIDKSKQNALDTLHDCLQTYYQVSHIATFSARKRPCNIFEMLCWVSGLPCNNVYQDMLDDAISELFVDPSKQPEDADGIPVTYISDEPLPAYPQNIAMDDTQRAVKRLCSRSHDILTTIAGTGDAYSMYAVDYSTNSLNFHYPSKGEDCLQMLLDILRRLLPSLKFLHTQCGLSSAYHGWSGCQYGRGVKHSNWQCGEHPANESTDCLPRSPLMSYLRDSLPGCLPHQLVSAGCKSECKTCPKSLPGAPCITPLGFRGFSGSTKTGKDICTVLTKFFDNSNINALFGLLPKPPSTLPEHFQFALTLSSMLDNANAASDVSLAFVTKTKALSIDLYKETSKLTGALQNAYRNQAGHTSSDHSKSTEADLSSLSKDSCNLPHERDIHCAPYLCSTSSDAYTYLAKKHADLYLSWAVYLPWTFYSYLKSLLDAFQQIDCGGSGCTKCSCKPGKHGVEYSCKCKALISCRGVMTTFYQYGFTFGDAKTLYGTNRKFCLSFSTQLSNLLKSQHFTKLFEECDNFIWTIREPFTYLVLALWSLSLFYLVCVMVGRLDVLHIKSHLRSPSSHKITAQSLLAAAQVGRLAKISYLQP